MKTLLITLLTLFATLACAQVEVRFLVLDADTDEALIGATVVALDSTAQHVIDGTDTDVRGTASLELHPGTYAFECTYTGYANQRTTVRIDSTGQTVPFRMTLVQSLNEVVVVGYSTTRSATISSSIVSVPSAAGRQPKRTKRTTKVRMPEATATAAPQSPAAGQLTAGHWRDIDKQEFWKKVLNEDFAPYQQQWQMFPRRTLDLTLVNRQKLPLIDAEVTLRRRDGTELWRARTDNTGRVALWVEPFEDATDSEDLRVEVAFEGNTYPIRQKLKPGKREAQLSIPVDCATAPVIDLLFAIDVSGSMGDELSFLQSELTDVIERVTATHDDKTVRTAAVAYQSPGDAFVTRTSPFTDDPAQTIAFFQPLRAQGGKGGAEAVEQALARALDLDWSERAVARVLFILLDEPPEADARRHEELRELVGQMAQRGIKVVPVVSSGAKRDLEYLMRAVSVMTNGTYAFLTDDSGIGDTHLKPITGSYEVFKLNDLLVKIVSDFAVYENCEELPVTNVETTPRYRISPNPVVDVLRVRTDEDFTRTQLFLHATDGALLKTGTPGDPELDLSDLPAGTYFLEIRSEKRAWVERVIVFR